jgi:hypothetical protein
MNRLGRLCTTASFLLMASACRERRPPTAERDPVAIPRPSSSERRPSATSTSEPIEIQRPWTLRPKTIGVRTGIEAPLIVRADGTSSLGAATNVTRVSDHYSACFVTKAARALCFGLTEGGTWNGVASMDKDVGLANVVDVAIHQTGACALTRDGAMHCWGKDGVPSKVDLPRPAKEIHRSISGRTCALLDDGTVATWAGAERAALVGLRGVRHVLACDVALVCGELEAGGVDCKAFSDSSGRRGVAEAQRGLVARLHELPRSASVAIHETGEAACAWTRAGVTCIHGAHSGTQTITLENVSEMALGFAEIGRSGSGDVACARTEDGIVHCWDLAQATPDVAKFR